MASRGSKKELSVRQEEHIAKLFEGKRSKSSGASVTDKGDVRAHDLLFECKMTMSTTMPTMVQQFEKVTKEALEEGLTPAMALRYYNPDSVLADKNGWVDLVVLRAEDAAEFVEDFYDN